MSELNKAELTGVPGGLQPGMHQRLRPHV